jgi:hypothetical protein
MRRLIVVLALAATLPVAAAAAAGSPPSASQVTAGTCKSFAANNADKFAKLFGSDSACQSALAGAAQSAIDSCLPPGTDAFKSCLSAKMNDAIKAVGDAKKAAADANLAKAAASVAANACKSASQGANFTKKFGTVDNCANKMAGAANSATRSCAADNKPGTDGFKACVGPKMSAAIKSYGK